MLIPKMDTALLRVLVTVAREGSLTRAAERLHLTQPALSLRLKRLHACVGVELLQRTPRGMRLTEAGRRLLPAAQRAVAAGEEFRTAASGLQGLVGGRLRIGTVVDPEFLRLGQFLRRLAERNPGLSLELAHGMSG